MTKQDYELIADSYMNFLEKVFTGEVENNVSVFMGWLVADLGKQNERFDIEKFQAYVEKKRQQVLAD